MEIKIHHSQTHGLSINGKQHPLYNMYHRMKTRCYNASKHNFPYYQGKGIKVCENLLLSVENFVNWAKENGWKKGLTIDRIDSNLDYSPDNCRLITLEENSRRSCKFSITSKNKKNAKLTVDQVLEIKNLLKSNILGTEIAKKFGVHKSCIYKIKHDKRWKDLFISPNC